MGSGCNKVFLSFQHAFGWLKCPAQEETAHQQDTDKRQQPDTAAGRKLLEQEIPDGGLFIKQHQ